MFETVSESGRDEAKAGLLERLRSGGELNDHVTALPALVEHSFDAGKLPAHSVQPFADLIGHLIRVAPSHLTCVADVATPMPSGA